MNNLQLNACSNAAGDFALPVKLSQKIALMVMLFAIMCSGCSIKRMAVNSVGDAIAGSGTVYASDDDVELIGQASPFGLKLMESLLAEAPEHRGLLLAAARGFTQYAFGYIHLPADELERTNVAASYTQRDRARRMYLRARDYGLRGLEVGHPGFTSGIHAQLDVEIQRTDPDDVALLYWTAAAWGAAIGLGKDDPALLAGIPIVEAFARRALALDESFEAGAVHGMMISLVMAKPGSESERIAAAERHFKRAVELSRGQAAAPYVTYAESVAVARGDRREFESLLGQALLVDKEAAPQWRLANEFFQRRASWLLARTDHYFAQ